MSWLSTGIKDLGHIAAPVVHRIAQGAGAVGGFAVGGPAGAVAGEQLGDKVGNVAQDALAGKGVDTSIKQNALPAVVDAAGLYGAHALSGAGAGAGAAPAAESSIPTLNPANAAGMIGTTAGGVDPGISAASGALAGVGGAAASAASNPGVVQSLENWLSGSQNGTAGSALAGAAGKLGGFLTGNNGLNALGVAQGVNQALNQKTATDYAKDALGTTTASYNARAPLRTQALASLMNPQTPSLVAVNRTMAQGNPWATGVPVTGGGIPATLPTTVPLPMGA